VASFLDRGGQILFDANVTAIDGIDGEHPAVTYVTADGQIGTATGTFIAGCDGRHGVSRQAMRANGFRRYDRDHGVSWLAVLARAPQSMAATTYAIHEDGFAGHMAGTETVTGYCLQCPRGADPSSWSEDRIWSELARRMRADRFGALKQGEIFERVVVDMGATVIDPLQQGRLFLVGDAASLISPPSAKGANLAVMEAETLALAMRRAIRHRADDELRRYSADCLPRIWRAQEFSHWMMNLLHGPSGEESEAVFMRALQRARLTGLQGSRTYQDHFAESFVGI
jgi:p-hydroxybenzoate 3-monooxygenase